MIKTIFGPADPRWCKPGFEDIKYWSEQMSLAIKEDRLSIPEYDRVEEYKKKGTGCNINDRKKTATDAEAYGGWDGRI